MDMILTAELLDSLLTLTGRSTAVREEVRVWSMSGVERLTFTDGTTAVFKYAKKPFDSEDQALRLAHTLGVPVPEVQASAVVDGWLGMLLEDLGPAVREADDLDGAAAAVALHRTRMAAALPVLDQEGLRGLPSRALEHLGRLRKAERWQDADDVEDVLDQIAQAAEARAAGTKLAPFGWVHSEFHPTSLHIGPHGWRLLDFARAFTGPGLLDLASWHGTLDTPDPVCLRTLLDTYVTEGGTPDALAARGGLPAEKWALGWHRMWAVEWFMEQSIRWINDPATDPAYIKAVRRHLTDVLHLLEV
ncbi:aminoglycoside phosphotransferase family protein [Streptomyces sp. S1A1-8]|uniref:aminoglycoside phosphotransferase family protein n=1 Tax=unclassified Streptomyces TaxID=2593676 RepID=UPI0011641BDA|nr:MULTISPECIES: aminoglycoside phosphotransferase family protein [unclassified Streptomyces]QDN96044.1 aminoglycoside phosphotransferase family protein [Streptomyces sp. RLB1-9]QDO17765.1 aminoglycoside phosphotransferase family protein [Streptomyces sp. S1A1-8]QDO27893.1 aminoglycoside phosphotransferase family protein [Streptomyces sp. S1A1-3]